MGIMSRMAAIVIAVSVGLGLGPGVSTDLMADHGISLDSTPKYPPGFTRFEYVSDKARVGGTLTLHAVGAFDKLNPFTFKGIAPEWLNTLALETLTVASLDEPFARYGLLAKEIQIAADGLSVLYVLRPEARFADGTPVMAEDVRFSFDLLRSEQAHPFYRTYWKDIQAVEVVDPHRVRFRFAVHNRELPLITGDMPVLSKAFFARNSFQDNRTVPLGSGPYRVEQHDMGKHITYRRRDDYWGANLPVRKGQFNFDRITVKYFRDPVVALEGFKAGEFDFMPVNNSKEWARDYDGERFISGQIRKEELPHQNGAGMQGFVFNLRRPVFQDVRVRRAIQLAFDFEWSNQNLFYGQYTRSNSYFSNSELAAQGVPTADEMAMLEPLRARLAPEVFQPPQPAPVTMPAPASLRQNLREASRLLKEAGWQMSASGMLARPDGSSFTIEMLLISPAFERIMAPFAANLKKLGIVLNYRTVDESLYQRRLDQFDYDMVVTTFAQSQSPGNEQRDYWHSSSAGVPGSRNLIGLKDPAVDALVERIVYAKSRKELVTACRALDRVLIAGAYVVPNFHIPYHRLAYWNRFERPEKLPLYYQPNEWLLSWWAKQP
jgi:microcin C transport system substrate-binding protein